jgi:hypothetical protein
MLGRVGQRTSTDLHSHTTLGRVTLGRAGSRIFDPAQPSTTLIAKLEVGCGSDAPEAAVGGLFSFGGVEPLETRGAESVDSAMDVEGVTVEEGNWLLLNLVYR